MATLRYVMTDLSKCMEKFIIYNHVLEDSRLSQWALTREMKNRQNAKMTITQGEILNHMIQNENRQDADHYYYKFRLSEVLQREMTAYDNRQATSKLEILVENLDHFYVVNKLKYSCEMFNRKNILAGEFSPVFLDEIIQQIRQNKFEGVPAVSIYYQIMLTLQEDNEEKHFYSLLQLLDAHFHLFSEEEGRDMYQFAQNYCIKKINAGFQKYLGELFYLYEKLLEKNLMLENLELSPLHYKNIIAVALRLEKFEWVAIFIGKYTIKLPSAIREGAKAYANALLNFNKADFRKTLKFLMDVEITDLFFNLDSRTLLIKAFYELKEYESLQYNLDALRIFLKRNRKISPIQREVYMNFVKFTRKLTRQALNDKDITLKMRNDILIAKNVADLTWLRKKTEVFGS